MSQFSLHHDHYDLAMLRFVALDPAKIKGPFLRSLENVKNADGRCIWDPQLNSLIKDSDRIALAIMRAQCPNNCSDYDKYGDCMHDPEELHNAEKKCIICFPEGK